MLVVDRPALREAASAPGWAVRRDWPGGHEFVGFRVSQLDAHTFALVDRGYWRAGGASVQHSVAEISAIDYERHVGRRLCTSAECPQGMALAEPLAGAPVGEVR